MNRVGTGSALRHVLIDISNVIHKCVYVCIKTNSFSQKELISRIYRSVLYTLNDITVYSEVNIFFDGKPVRRQSLYPEYKGHSNAVPLNDSLVQIGTNRSDLTNTLIALFQKSGFDSYYDSDQEADDLIASFCRLHEDKLKIIVSEDKDFYSLLSDPRTVIYNSSSKDYVDSEASSWKWGKGVRIYPDKVVLFKSLYGDPSDNIFGIPRLRKSLFEKLSKYGCIDSLLGKMHAELPNEVCDYIIKYKDRILLNESLVKLKSDLDLDPIKTRHSLDLPGLRTSLLNDFSVELDLGVLSRNKHVLQESLPDWYNEI